MKEEFIGPPELYLGGHLRHVQLENGVEAWAYSSSYYVRAAVENVEDYLAKEENKRWKLPAKAETPMSLSYRPELDVTPELGPKDATYYQSLIGILQCGESGHMFGSVCDVLMSSPTSRGTLGAGAAYLCTSEEV